MRLGRGFWPKGAWEATVGGRNDALCGLWGEGTYVWLRRTCVNCNTIGERRTGLQRLPSWIFLLSATRHAWESCTTQKKPTGKALPAHTLFPNSVTSKTGRWCPWPPPTPPPPTTPMTRCRCHWPPPANPCLTRPSRAATGFVLSEARPGILAEGGVGGDSRRS